MYVEDNKEEELADLAVGFNPIPNQPYIVNDMLFDATVALNIDECDVFHGWTGHSLYTMRELGKDTVKIVNLFSAHIEDQAKILNPEMKMLYGEVQPMVSEMNIEKVTRELEMADIIHVPSEFIFRTLQSRGLGDKTVINPFGVNLDQFKMSKADRDGKFRVIFVGSNWLRKGLIYLLEAWKKLNLKNAELIVAGVREPVMELPNVTYGWYSHDELVDLYNSSNVFCLPALEDGCPLVTYEAMACNLPVIISHNTGTAQMVRHGHNGFVVPVKDVEAIMDSIKKIYDEPEYGVYLGKNARKTVEAYTWENYETRYMDIIKNI
jgi:glycosyltransferase involved in cell wall biosynthesis